MFLADRFALSMLAAMYVAAYDQFTILDVYPFIGLLVISLLLFRFESRVVAAVLVGVHNARLLHAWCQGIGDRDAERSLLKLSEYATHVVAYK